jgi:hypothetical protein
MIATIGSLASGCLQAALSNERPRCAERGRLLFFREAPDEGRGAHRRAGNYSARAPHSMHLPASAGRAEQYRNFARQHLARRRRRGCVLSPVRQGAGSASIVASRDSGNAWRGVDVTAKGRHWAVPHAELDKLDKQGRIHWPKKEDGVPQRKRYMDELPGMPLQDLILDIRPVHNVGKARLGYPTQKPIDLLDRIIRASSKKGQVIC